MGWSGRDLNELERRGVRGFLRARYLRKKGTSVGRLILCSKKIWSTSVFKGEYASKASVGFLLPSLLRKWEIPPFPV